MKKVACSEFVKRQTKESGYSHFEGTWEQLESLVENHLTHDIFRPGYRDGVILVDIVQVWRFYSSIVDLNENSKLVANYAPRQEGEDPFVRVAAKGDKQAAKHVSIVLYRHDVLAEDNDRSSDAEWEIIAIKARTSDKEEPMDPYTMARNFLHLKGGTKGDFTAEQFAESIVFWSNHCMTAGKPKWYKRLAEWWRE